MKQVVDFEEIIKLLRDDGIIETFTLCNINSLGIPGVQMSIETKLNVSVN